MISGRGADCVRFGTLPILTIGVKGSLTAIRSRIGW
jgi:hypothetical protein